MGRNSRMNSMSKLDKKIMSEAAKPGKGVLNNDLTSPDGPSGLCCYFQPLFGKGRRVRIPNRAFVPTETAK